MKILSDDQHAGLVNPLLQAAKAQVDAPQPALSAKDVFKKGVRGRGGYWGNMFGSWLGGLTGNSTIKSLASSAFDSAGDYISGLIPGGDLMASGAEMLHKSISGRGDYEMSSSASVPSFGGGEVDHVRVKSREYLGPISGAANFTTVADLLINPGNHVAFPQLAKLAAHYQQYIMRGLIFYYKATSSVAVAAADPSLGQVIMAFNYDASEPAYTSKAEMLQSQYASAGAPCQDIAHGVECAAFSNGTEVKRIRHGFAGESISDPMNTDVGRFQLSVEGTNAAASRIGELWVTYDIVLIKRKDSKGSEVPLCDVQFKDCKADNLFPLTRTTFKHNTLGVNFSVGNGRIEFPRFVDDGRYQMHIYLIVNGGANFSASGTVSSGEYFYRWPAVSQTLGCTVNNMSGRNLDGDYTYNSTNSAATLQSCSSVVATYLVDINTSTTNPVASIQFSNTAGDTIWPIGSATGDVRIVISRVPDFLTHL